MLLGRSNKISHRMVFGNRSLTPEPPTVVDQPVKTIHRRAAHSASERLCSVLIASLYPELVLSVTEKDCCHQGTSDTISYSGWIYFIAHKLSECFFKSQCFLHHIMLVNRSAPEKSELSTQTYNQHFSHLIYHLGFILSISLARDHIRSLEKNGENKTLQ